MFTLRKASITLACAAAAAGTMASSASAASVGDLCHPGPGGATIYYAPINNFYWVGQSGWIRIDGFRDANTYWAHGTGHPVSEKGYTSRSSIDQSTCHS